jgi:hypothetical protein
MLPLTSDVYGLTNVKKLDAIKYSFYLYLVISLSSTDIIMRCTDNRG